MDANLEPQDIQNNFWAQNYYQYELCSMEQSQQYQLHPKPKLSQHEILEENELLGVKSVGENKHEMDFELFKVFNQTFRTQPGIQKFNHDNTEALPQKMQRRTQKSDLQKDDSTSGLSYQKLGKKASKHIFKEKCVRKMTKKFAISKFLVRLFLKHHEEYAVSSETRNYNREIKTRLIKFNQNKFNLQRDAMKFLNPSVEGNGYKIGQENRFVMSRIIQDKIRKEVIMNTSTQRNRISYLIGCKIYALRCRSDELCRKANFR